MTAYRAPLRDLRFVLHELAGLDRIAELPGYGEAAEVADAVLDEAATFASEVLDPLNAIGDREGCRWSAGEVTTPPGFREAYSRFAQAGWIGLPVSPEHGGQGLPQVLLGATLEMWNAANVGFANGPLLNQAAIEAIELVGSEEQRRRYVPKLVSGEWTGTMCLTEPQAGSDLAAVRTIAVPAGDHHRIRGQKIFITFGEHDMTPNIIHLVLARLPDAPAGTKGISLFIVPKVLVNDDGTLGERNDVVCGGLEHKLGLHGNPTATLNYGERTGGAIGYLVGEPNRGLEQMFIMMNAARFSVGVQALGIADRAYQSALAHARQRVQSREAGAASPEGVPIIRHPDVRRMLMSMKAQIEAMRALALTTAAAIDLSLRHPDETVRRERRAFVDLMIPIVKGWCTETAVEICSTALQVFGGSGYIEETGIAQQYRDIRITTIYEGTTGIQALDLVGRKLVRDLGAAATRAIGEIRTCAKALEANRPPLAATASLLAAGADALAQVSGWIGTSARSDLRRAVACSVPYLTLWGVVAGGWQLARSAEIAAARLADDAAGDDAEFYRAKLLTAQFYADHVLSRVPWLRHQIVEGSSAVLALRDEQYELDRRAMVGV